RLHPRSHFLLTLLKLFHGREGHDAQLTNLIPILGRAPQLAVQRRQLTKQPIAILCNLVEPRRQFRQGPPGIHRFLQGRLISRDESLQLRPHILQVMTRLRGLRA
ncbi:MAG: hypothetical protein ACK55I_18840, partial [bacterium]